MVEFCGGFGWLLRVWGDSSGSVDHVGDVGGFGGLLGQLFDKMLMRKMEEYARGRNL